MPRNPIPRLRKKATVEDHKIAVVQGLAAIRPTLMRGASLMGIWFAVMLHTAWVIALLSDPATKNATAVHGPALLFPNRYGLALLLVVVAGCATAGIFMELSRLKIALLVPQQIMLGFSAAAALEAMTAGHFADGIQRSQWFIISDQAPAVIALVIHSMTILYLAKLLGDGHKGAA